jgi:CheY-like chemotaxis protein
VQSSVVAAAAVATARPRILVVDDERFVRESIADLLELEGYSVRVAEDGREVLRASA